MAISINWVPPNPVENQRYLPSGAAHQFDLFCSSQFCKRLLRCSWSGHKQLSSVEKYIEVTEEEKISAVSTLW
jgi:hypothetical protein